MVHASDGLENIVIDIFHIFMYSFQANSVIATCYVPRPPTADPQLHFFGVAQQTYLDLGRLTVEVP